MFRTTVRRPSASLAVASLALLVAGSGTGYAAAVAAGSVGTRQLKANAVTSPKIRNGSVTGADVRESSLGRVPRAANATRVGGTPVTGLMRTAGCQTGKVLGFARVRANAGTIPVTYGTAGIDIAHNCAGGTVEVRRSGTGRYFVRFVDNPAAFAFTQVRFDDDTSDEAACSTVRKVTVGGDADAFAVTTLDCSTDSVVNADFTLLLP